MRKHVVLLKILQCGGEIWGLRGGETVGGER